MLPQKLAATPSCRAFRVEPPPPEAPSTKCLIEGTTTYPRALRQQVPPPFRPFYYIEWRPLRRSRRGAGERRDKWCTPDPPPDHFLPSVGYPFRPFYYIEWRPLRRSRRGAGKGECFGRRSGGLRRALRILPPPPASLPPPSMGLYSPKGGLTGGATTPLTGGEHLVNRGRDVGDGGEGAPPPLTGGEHLVNRGGGMHPLLTPSVGSLIPEGEASALPKSSAAPPRFTRKVTGGGNLFYEEGYAAE